MFGKTKKAVQDTAKSTAKTAAEEFVLTAEEKVREAVTEAKNDIKENAGDLLPYVIVGGIVLIGIGMLRRQPPITVKVVIKQQ